MEERSISRASVAGLSELETSKVLRNTYLLLSMTMAFSALVAFVAMTLQVSPINHWLALGGVLGLSFAINRTADSGMGLVLTFVLTGFLGYFLGPILSIYMSYAPQAVSSALATTAVAFLGLSGLALVTKKDFSFMTTFVHVGWMVLLATVVLGLIFDLSAIHMAICGFVVLLTSATIVWQTSAIIHGGETNYIRATVTLFMSIFNMFTALLQIFAGFGDD